jgi:hypothetical protein
VVDVDVDVIFAIAAGRMSHVAESKTWKPTSYKRMHAWTDDDGRTEDLLVGALFRRRKIFVQLFKIVGRQKPQSCLCIIYYFPARQTTMASPLALSSTTDETWNHLVAWIKQAGGYVHGDLQLRAIDNDPQQQQQEHAHKQEKAQEHRGVFCSQHTIKKGECLIRLPAALAVSGKDLPSQYKLLLPGSAVTNTARMVSTWLRCLAAYYQAQQDPAQKAYMASLPESYETIFEWSDDEIRSYLAGTTTATAGSDVGWNQQGTGDGGGNDAGVGESQQRQLLRERYRDQIRPYLQHCGCLGDDNDKDTDKGAVVISDTELDRFQRACQCLSTRGFHLTLPEQDDADAGADVTSSAPYNGPFLLPWIDLLNHRSSSTSSSHADGSSDTANNNNNNNDSKCTTLTRLPDDTFVMLAERDILPGQEILHSYGDDLTASQCLQTFGFVPETAVERACRSLSSNINSSIPVTPAVLSKTAVLEACWAVMESNIPEQLAASMREQEMEDEVWAVAVDRSRTATFIPDDLLIELSDSESLTDELVTLACVPFFPRCAYAEMSARTLLDVSMLEDYYLGKLVCTSLLKAIQSKLETYTPVRRTNGNVNGSNDINDVMEPAGDRELLQQVVQQEQTNPNISTRRLMYGLVIRLEEKACLEALRRNVIGILARLDEEADLEEYTNGRGEGENDKRPRMNNE